MSFFEKDIKKLGFGLMRLPQKDGAIDIEQVKQMVDAFMAAGFTYFDTAWAYPGSEDAIRQALVERYPRESFQLATKNAAWIACKTREDAIRQFDDSLRQAGVDYFDNYLLHNLGEMRTHFFDDFDMWTFVKEKKAEGKIKHWGFSFHADPELLEELLEAHPDAEFVQLQINYADWENPGVASRRNWEICKAHGKPVIVMEPVKGGILADPIDTVKAVFDKENNGLSYSSWALRFVASKDNLLTVLSGMSSLEQMEDNLSFMKDFQPLNAHEEEVIKEAQKALDADQSIPCTGCRYCTKGCPMGIPIPDIFTVANRRKGSPEFRTIREYNIVTQGKGKASDCIGCGQCEDACPQQLPIISLLEECRAFEG